jgi:hypothetical protein
LLFGYTFALEFARVKQASTGKTLVLCGIWAAEFVACGVLATMVVLKAARSADRLDRRRPASRNGGGRCGRTYANDHLWWPLRSEASGLRARMIAEDARS